MDQRSVEVVGGFWMGETPVTQAQWEALGLENEADRRGADRPMERVDWWGAMEFVRRLGRVVEGAVWDLPSEVEWEYACRAGGRSATYGGELVKSARATFEVLDPIAWFAGNVAGGSDAAAFRGLCKRVAEQGAQPVGRKLPNAWGLSDMIGNVWEWCADGVRSDEAAMEVEAGVERADLGLPVQAGAEHRRVVRGGSWGGSARHCRAAARRVIDPRDRDDDLGFRIVEVASRGEDRCELAERRRLLEGL